MILRDSRVTVALWPPALTFAAIVYSPLVAAGMVGVALLVFLLAIRFRHRRGHQRRCTALGALAIVLSFEWL
ncbi:hypothetical protein RM844_10550 [Streptomyces sp. DSM 44915]|uniref:Uncharacterized protein n=1 Tax=Streptomyces chisholmiae TaxID=3075540 RepID=A0ABU2JP12_9ACTN|nr:hypothetical protein [Streptomyces sp. DSM 44915]MDT0266733.1 hypothetical protein [Streptomyces sp. DSM 44915]